MNIIKLITIRCDLKLELWKRILRSEFWDRFGFCVIEKELAKGIVRIIIREKNEIIQVFLAKMSGKKKLRIEIHSGQIRQKTKTIEKHKKDKKCFREKEMFYI